MIQVVGAVLITAGTGAWGIMSVIRLRQRVASLQALSSAIGVMKSEICDRLTPMPELLDMLSDEAAYPSSQLFKNASEKMTELGSRPFSFIWNQAVKSTPELMLTQAEEVVLTQLGQCLGRYDVGEQRSALQYAQRRLDDLTRRAENDRDRNSKVHAFLGISAGLFAMIILL